MRNSPRRRWARAGLWLAAPLVVGALGAGAAGAQNLLVNPDFDQDFDGWTVACGGPMAWSSGDEGGCPGSGALSVPSGPCGGFEGGGAGQCLAVGAMTEIHAGARVRAGAGLAGVAFDFFDGAGCTGTSLGESTSPAVPAVGSWLSVSFTEAVPAGSVSVAVGFGVVSSVPIVAEVDAAYAGARPLVFRDDFEGDTEATMLPCRWSSAAP